MRIISTTPELKILAQSTDYTPVDRLIKHHLAGALFDIKPFKQTKGHSTRLELTLREAFSGTQGHISGAASCVIDLATRLAALPSLGSCELSEYEVHWHSSQATRELWVEVDIELINHECSTFYCALYARLSKGKRLLAESQGTLLKRTAALTHQQPMGTTQC